MDKNYESIEFACNELDRTGNLCKYRTSSMSSFHDHLKDHRKSKHTLLKDYKINHPAHYNTGKFEVIDVIEDWKLGFNLGNAIKYIARSDHKRNKLEDLKKSLWYLQREINNLEKINLEKINE